MVTIISQPFIVQGKPVRLVAWDWRNDDEYEEDPRVQEVLQVTWADSSDPEEGWLGDIVLTENGWIAGGDERIFFDTPEGAAFALASTNIDYLYKLSDEDLERLMKAYTLSLTPGLTPLKENPMKNPPALTEKEERLLKSLKPQWGWQVIEDKHTKAALELANKSYVMLDSSDRGKVKLKLTKQGMDIVKKNPSRTKNVSEDHPEYHRRNVILPHEVRETLQGWTGGQSSMTYSLMSTGMNDYVSPSMIDAAVSELEYDLGKLKAKKDRESKKLAKELEELIGELDGIARFSDEFSTLEYTGEDKDSGYATWLMEKEENPIPPSKTLKNKLLR